MPTMFRVSRIQQTEYYEVYARDLISGAEWNARLDDLLRKGWSRGDALHEMSAMQPERKLNQTPTCTARLCEQFVYQHVDPGDIVIFLDRVFVCGAEVQA